MLGGGGLQQVNTTVQGLMKRHDRPSRCASKQGYVWLAWQKHGRLRAERVCKRATAHGAALGESLGETRSSWLSSSCLSGETFRPVNKKEQTVFCSFCPHAGSDNFDNRFPEPIRGFNPRTPRGERQHSAIWSVGQRRFYPRSPHGERQMSGDLLALVIEFQPTHPA